MLKKPVTELGRLSVEAFRASGKTPVRVVLDNVRSMHNVGSVFRTADAFRIEGIDLCGYTPRPPHRDIHKTALGATETVAWGAFDDAAECVRRLRAQGYLVFAVEQAHGSRPLQHWHHRPGMRVAVVFGNEAEGVGEAVIRACDGCLEIPQLGMKHSLNVSVAAGIVLWELSRGAFGAMT
jgi:23S rRNA (guanosine2251-2'-O)-methyltransferase